MMTKRGGGTQQQKDGTAGLGPLLKISKLGIVSRDYRRKYQNRCRDFSHAMPDVLRILDTEGCDAVLFSLFSIIPRASFDVIDVLERLGQQSVKTVFLEEFQDGDRRSAGRFEVLHRTERKWDAYCFYQKFGTITRMPKKAIDDFVKEDMPRRVFGNCCVLLCGETNGVKYSPKDKKVIDLFGLRTSIPQKARIILNPGHDRMIRFEMTLKRQFLSERGRWVISVWNKGRENSKGKIRDGNRPAWTIFHNGKEKKVEPIQNDFGVEIGVLDLNVV